MTEINRPPDVNDIKEKLELLSRDFTTDTTVKEDVSFLNVPQTSVVVGNRPNLVWNFPENAPPVPSVRDRERMVIIRAS